MSANDRSRHLEQFVAESEPPPQAQHLPPMPSASQRFAAMQEQQLAAQRRGNVINFIDPYSHGKSVAGAPEFNPFQSLVMRTAQQNDDESESTDDDTSETTDDTISTSADSNPKKPIRVTVPTKVAAVKPTASQRPSVAKPLSPPAPPTTAAPTTVVPVPVVTVTPAPVVPVSAATATPAAAAPTVAPPTAEEEPRGIMDQSMAFLKKNFWAILTVIVVLVALGVAFIYFARPRANETTVPKVAPQVKTNGPPGTPARWSNVENEIIAPAEEITKLQKEKQEAESANEELQKRMLSIEAEVKNASQEQQAHLRDIEKLQKICDQLQAEKDSLKEDNTHMAEFIMQNNLLPGANKPDEKPEEPAATATLPASSDETIAPETVAVTTDEREDQQQQQQQQQQEENTEKIDVDAIEKSAVEETQFETIDETQPTDEKINEPDTNKEPEEEKQEEEVIVEEKLPWQK